MSPCAHRRHPSPLYMSTAFTTFNPNLYFALICPVGESGQFFHHILYNSSNKCPKCQDYISLHTSGRKGSFSPTVVNPMYATGTDETLNHLPLFGFGFIGWMLAHLHSPQQTVPVRTNLLLDCCSHTHTHSFQKSCAIHTFLSCSTCFCYHAAVSDRADDSSVG